MERIATSTVAEDLFGAGKDGFTNGNPAGGVPATQLSAAFLNAVQEEIANVIEGASITLDPAVRTQLKSAILAMIAAGSYLRPANNLSDVSSTATALTNLGFVFLSGANYYVMKFPSGDMIQIAKTTTFPVDATLYTTTLPFAYTENAIVLMTDYADYNNAAVVKVKDLVGSPPTGFRASQNQVAGSANNHSYSYIAIGK